MTAEVSYCPRCDRQVKEILQSGFCKECWTKVAVDVLHGNSGTGFGIPPKDNINPSHYRGSVDCIDAMVQCFGIDAVRIHCKLTAFAYLWRSDKKNGDEDVRKASWYLKFASGDDPRK